MNISTNDKIKLAYRVAWFAAGFAALMAVLLIANYVQTRLNNPIDNKIIPALVKRLSENPQDEALKTEIRAFDLMARKAYFTSQWQLRNGSYLMFLGVILSVLAVRYILGSRSKLNEIDSIDKLNGLDKLVAQKWIVYSGTGLIVLALVSGILSYNSLTDYQVNENGAEEPNSAVAAEVMAGPVTPVAPEMAEAKAATTAAVDTSKAVLKENIAPATPVAPAAFPTRAELKANYPYFRGPDGDGISYQKKTPVDWNGAAGKNVIWKVKIPKTGFSSPIIWGNQLFVTGADEQARMIYCYDTNSGKLIWEVAADQIKGSPAGIPKVTKDTGLAAPTMATDGRSVFALFATGDLIALDLTGKRLWAHNLGLPDNHYGHASSLIIFKDKLLIQFDTNRSAKLTAFSTQTGEVIWETTRNSKISWSSPVLVNTGNRMELILTTNPNVNSYDPQTGKELWNIACLSGEVGPSAGYADGMVFAANEYSKLVGIKLGAKPEIVWQADEFLPEVASPLAVNGLLFIATTYGVLACYDAKTGEKFWSQEYGDSFYASPVYADGKVYATNMSGKTYIIKATKEYQLIGTPELGEKSVCAPVFTEGRIYLRGMNQLYCLGTK